MKNDKKLTYFIIAVCIMLSIIGVSIGYKLSQRSNENKYDEIRLGDSNCTWTIKSQSGWMAGSGPTDGSCHLSSPSGSPSSSGVTYCYFEEEDSYFLCQQYGVNSSPCHKTITYGASCSTPAPNTPAPNTPTPKPATPTPTQEPTQTPTCSIANCKTCANDGEHCSTCESGYELAGYGYSCVKIATPTPKPATPTPTTSTIVNCCVNGSYRSSIDQSYCISLGGTVVSSQSQCTSPTPTSTSSNTTPTPAPTSTILNCIKFSRDDNSCSAVTIVDTRCENVSNTYSSWEACRNYIVCGANEYKYGNSCLSCPNGTVVKNSNCQGNSTTCCVANSPTPTPTATPLDCLSQNKYYNTRGNYCLSCPTGSSLKNTATQCSGTDDQDCCTSVSTPTPVPTSSTLSYVQNIGDGCSDGKDCQYTKISTLSVCSSHQLNAPCYSVTISTCPAGYACKNGTKDSCGPGTYSSYGSSNCLPCTGNTYSSGYSSKSCSTCTGTVNESHTACSPYQSTDTTVTCPAGMYVPKNSSVCQACPAGYACANAGTYNKNSSEDQGITSNCKSGNLYSYGGATHCSTCNTTVNSAHTVCAQCSVGYYMGENNVCQACPAGSYCSDGISATSCPNGKTSSIKATSSSACYTKTEDNDCKITVSTTSDHVSVDSDSTHQNSYYSVAVTVTGNGCNGQSLSYSATNYKEITPKLASGGYGVGNVSSGATYYFNVYPKAVDCRGKSTATATLTNGKSGTVSVDVVLDDWKEDGSNTDCFSRETVNANTSASSLGSHDADDKGLDEYYTAYGKCPNSNEYGFTEHWVRGGCATSGSSGGSSTSSPKRKYCFANAPSIEDATAADWLESKTNALPYQLTEVSYSDCIPYACYGNASTIDSSTNVIWTKTTSVPTGYVKISVSRNQCIKNVEGCYGNGPTLETSNDLVWSTVDLSSKGYHLISNVSKTQCVNPVVEAPACYKNKTTGEKVWGKYNSIPGYELLPITNETDCTSPGEMACYKSNDGTYYWGIKANDSDIFIDDVSDPSDCGLPEEEACYEYGSEYVWGKYSHSTGYKLIDSITSSAACTKEEPACYKDKGTGSYVWGRFEKNSGYDIVSGVSKDECNNDVYVPRTAADVQTIIYVGIALLIVFGLGFMYYSFNNKKEI